MRAPVIIGDCTLYQGDCLEIVPILGKIDAVVTDPPYGIDYGNQGSFQASHGWRDLRENLTWDSSRPSSDVFSIILEYSKEQIIWGGNYFTDLLPPTMRWLIWDKGQVDFSLADFEIAWTSQNKAARRLFYPRARALKEEKQHPTQKPLEVMKWCLGFVASSGTILDPFMGSGTTGVACVKLGRKFIGIEMEPKYFDIACKRVEQAYAQPDMFVEPIAKPVQEKLEL